MKKSAFIVILAICILHIVCFTQCKKDSSLLNITLYDKPIVTIQPYIVGKWRVHYQYGGFCATCKSDRESYNEYYEFGANNSIKYTYQDMQQFDTTYEWISNQSTFNRNVMEYHGASISPSSHLQPYSIKNDTLILAQPFFPSPDYSQFFLTKIK